MKDLTQTLLALAERGAIEALWRLLAQCFERFHPLDLEAPCFDVIRRLDAEWRSPPIKQFRSFDRKLQALRSRLEELAFGGGENSRSGPWRCLLGRLQAQIFRQLPPLTYAKEAVLSAVSFGPELFAPVSLTTGRATLGPAGWAQLELALSGLELSKACPVPDLSLSGDQGRSLGLAFFVAWLQAEGYAVFPKGLCVLGELVREGDRILVRRPPDHDSLRASWVDRACPLIVGPARDSGSPGRKRRNRVIEVYTREDFLDLAREKGWLRGEPPRLSAAAKNANSGAAELATSLKKSGPPQTALDELLGDEVEHGRSTWSWPTLAGLCARHPGAFLRRASTTEALAPKLVGEPEGPGRHEAFSRLLQNGQGFRRTLVRAPRGWGLSSALHAEAKIDPSTLLLRYLPRTHSGAPRIEAITAAARAILIQRTDWQICERVYRTGYRHRFAATSQPYWRRGFQELKRLDRLQKAFNESLPDNGDPLAWLHPAEIIEELRESLPSAIAKEKSQGRRVRIIVDGLENVPNPGEVVAFLNGINSEIEIIISTCSTNPIAGFEPDRVIDIEQHPELAGRNQRAELFLREASADARHESALAVGSPAKRWWSSLGSEQESVISMMAILLVAKGPLKASELVALCQGNPEDAGLAFVRLRNFLIPAQSGFIAKFDELWVLWHEGPGNDWDFQKIEESLLSALTPGDDPRQWSLYGRQFALAHDRALRDPARFASRLADPRFLAACLPICGPLAVLRECDALLRQHPDFDWPALTRLAIHYVSRRQGFLRDHPEAIEQALGNDWPRWTEDLGSDPARQVSLTWAETLSAPWRIVEAPAGRSGVFYDFGTMGLALSRGGSAVLSGSASGIHLWDGLSGAELAFAPELEACGGIRGSPNGRWAAFLNTKYEVCVVDLRRERCVHILPTGPAAPFAFFGSGVKTELLRVNGASFTVTTMESWSSRTAPREGCAAISALAESLTAEQLLLVGTEGGELELWSLSELRCVKHWKAHESAIRLIVLLRDGTQAMTSSNDGSLALWDLQAARELRRADLGVVAKAIETDSLGLHAVLTWSSAPMHCVWNLETGEWGRGCSTTNTHCALALLDDNRAIVSSGLDDRRGIVSTSIWHFKTGEIEDVESWSFSPWAPILRTVQGVVIGKLADWGLGLLRDLRETPQVVCPPRPCHGPGQIEAGGAQAFMLSPVPAVELWDLAAHQCVAQYEGHRSDLRFCAAHEQEVYGICAEGELIVWDRQSAKELKRITGLPTYPRCLKILGDDRSVGIGCRDGSWQLWDVRSAQLRSTFETQINAGIFDLAPFQGGVLSASESSLIHYWDLSSGEGRRWNRDPADSIHCLDVDSQRPWILTGSEDGGLRVWEAATGRLLRLMKANASWLTQILAFPDRRLVLAAYVDSSLRLWDVETGRCLSMTELPASVAAMAWVGGQTALIVDDAAQKRLLRFEPELGEAGLETLEVLRSRQVDEIPPS